MSRKGPIVIVEDDEDDQQMLRDVFGELEVPNQLLIFDSCPPALDYLTNTTDQPFVILCDVNLPGMSGTELKQVINEDDYLRRKAIPFIFYTTAIRRQAVDQAYDALVQGYFEKPITKSDIKGTIKLILDYWRTCVHPNNMS